MFSTGISNNAIIVINKGDTFTTLIPINFREDIDIDDYEMGPEDNVYFAICEPNQPFECAAVRKIFTLDDLDVDGNVIIKLVPSDTYYLLSGTYYYEVKLKVHVSGDDTDIIKTIIPKRKLVIC